MPNLRETAKEYMYPDNIHVETIVDRAEIILALADGQPEKVNAAVAKAEGRSTLLGALSMVMWTILAAVPLAILVSFLGIGPFVLAPVTLGVLSITLTVVAVSMQVLLLTPAQERQHIEVLAHRRAYQSCVTK